MFWCAKLSFFYGIVGKKKKKILKTQKYAILYYQEQTIILMLLAYKSSEITAQKQWDCCTKAMRLQYTKK